MKKIVLIISIALNIILIGIIAWQMYKTDASELNITSKTQMRLIELEGEIGYQMENDWVEPSLVTFKLGQVLDNLETCKEIGKQSGALSEKQIDTLNNLYANLSKYPQNESYELAQLTEKDKENFENLRQYLREAELGLNISVRVDNETFMKQAAALDKKIPMQLDVPEQQ